MGKDCFWLGRLAAAVAKSWFMATELKLQVALARETVDIMNERLAQRVNLHLALGGSFESS